MNQKLDITSTEQLAMKLVIDEETLIEISNNTDKYIHHKIISKENKRRTLVVPNGELKHILKFLNIKVLQKIELPAVIKGGRKNMSIYKNAKLHCGQKAVATLDVKDFFPSISSNRVYHALIGAGFTEIVADLLVKLSTYKGRLPLGFPTSSSLANLVIIPMAHRLQKLADQHNLKCSFWVDDITISGSMRVGKLRNLINKIVTQEGFKINEKKGIKLMENNKPQIVTKLSVNSTKPKVMKEYRKNLRSLLRHCVTQGPASQTNDCLKKFKRSLLGKISFVKSIDETRGIKLQRQFDRINWN